jgi:aminoglycoside 3-N-acetyltransferase
MNSNNNAVETSQKIIEESLKKVGVEEGDIILVHSDGSPAMHLGDFEWWEDALDFLKQCFLNVLGKDGTLFVPTFNYDFGKGKPYSHEKSPSQVGMFSNNILFDQRSIRSFHPIFSFAGIGRDAKEICNHVSKSAFGEGSVFHKLHQMNAKIVFFNVGFRVCTFLHYVEQCKGVEYRFLKTFNGQVNKDGLEYEDDFDAYVRHLDRNVETYAYFERLEGYLSSKNVLNKITFSDQYSITLARCHDIYQAAIKKIEFDPYYLIEFPLEPVSLEITKTNLL